MKEQSGLFVCENWSTLS